MYYYKEAKWYEINHEIEEYQWEKVLRFTLTIFSYICASTTPAQPQQR